MEVMMNKKLEQKAKHWLLDDAIKTIIEIHIQPNLKNAEDDIIPDYVLDYLDEEAQKFKSMIPQLSEQEKQKFKNMIKNKQS